MFSVKQKAINSYFNKITEKKLFTLFPVYFNSKNSEKIQFRILLINGA